VNTPADVRKTKKAIKKSFRTQLENKGFSLVEVLSMCPTSWRMDSIASLDFINTMEEYFPCKVFKDIEF
jgi:2-oxoglutarate ferredoxin oxidoreductase subunit beta